MVKTQGSDARGKDYQLNISLWFITLAFQLNTSQPLSDTEAPDLHGGILCHSSNKNVLGQL